MRRIVCLLTALAVALQATGLAFTSRVGEVTAIGYGSAGYPDTVTDALTNTSNLELDTLGRVTWVEDPIQAATGSTADRTDIAYDEWGRQELITHPPKFIGDTRHTTQFQYDAVGVGMRLLPRMVGG
jgi:hypothetical protein